MQNPRDIARKLGYKGSALTSGTDKVKKTMKQLGLKIETPDPEIDRFLKKHNIV